MISTLASHGSMCGRMLGFATLFAALVAIRGCTFPATEVLVIIDTDIDRSVPMTIVARVWQGRDASGEPSERSWVRASGVDGGRAGEGVDLPASFAVVPGEGPRDGAVTLLVEADAGGVLLRRRAQFAFVPRQTTVLRIFLTSRCAALTATCRSGALCTVQRYCEERGETCGNEGSCVRIDVMPSSERDGSFGDVRPPERCGLYGMACCALGEACVDPLTCVAGRCQRCTDPEERCCAGGDLLADGTECGPAPDACHRAPVCNRGVCQSPAALPDGTVCNPTSNPCQRDGVCNRGVCGAMTNVPDGTVCNPTSNPCQRDGVCNRGVCGAMTNVPDGTVCAPARNECETDGRCNGGSCGARGTRPDGTPWGSGGLNRCCGGMPVTLTTSSNCGACGLTCASGQPCVRDPTYGHYYCRCTSNAQCGWGICRTATPGANNCACTGSCPGGATCYDISGPNYCGYP